MTSRMRHACGELELLHVPAVLTQWGLPVTCMDGYNLALTERQHIKPDVALISSMGVTSASHQVKLACHHRACTAFSVD